MNKFKFIACILLASFVCASDSKLSGDPGEIFALRLDKEKFYDNMTIDIDGTKFVLLPLPFHKQGSYVEFNGIKIFVNKKDFGESRINVDSSMVTLNAKNQERTKKESEIINKALNKFSRIHKSNLNFNMPLNGIISSKYGKKRFINGLPRSPHLALDIAAPSGTEIVAPESGTVILVGSFFYSGNYLIIDHGFGLLSSYSHLSKVNVNLDEFVDQGKKIGEVGATGRVTGPHLHWSIYLNKTRINPESLIVENYLDSIL